jgi:hypothetical protein
MEGMQTDVCIYAPIATLPVHPGNVATDMLTRGLKHAPPELSRVELLTPEESAAAVLEVIDYAARDESGPRLLSFDGSSVLPW